MTNNFAFGGINTSLIFKDLQADVTASACQAETNI